MNRGFFSAFAARAFSMAAATCAGMISLKLYKNNFTPEVFGIIGVAVQSWVT